ncbi:hypothetical protein Tbd_0966 [Thiobacillus denitrificans ATCC 25259]|uniref:Uncharacterized protein n=1 Tax=Thiobacillus denitrificans (strain ATCC 25259 / T1) TaxID=292415 RepID=Q3SK71_THIDA|nr:hypothetical protein [Thiobacillus denitrificans]AAZ96919.1 hypothetical protein Tbd_0966 [Thiobacillus denitrificans ATCC 25259]
MKRCGKVFVTAALLGTVFPAYPAEAQQADDTAPAAQSPSDAPSAAEVRQKLGSAADAIKRYSADKRDEAAQKAKVALDLLDRRMDALETDIDRNWERMDAAARARSREAMRALQDERVEVAEWYGSLKSSTASAWEETRQGFVRAYQALQRDWENAERQQADDASGK